MKAIVPVADLHVASTVALAPKAGIKLPDGGLYQPNSFQRTLHKFWEYHWSTWVPAQARGADSLIVPLVGDLIDGNHHGTINIVSPDADIQKQAALEVIYSIKKLCPLPISEFFVIRGTEAHTGPNGQSEDWIAKELGCRPTATGEHSGYQLWLEVDGVVMHFAHSISGGPNTVNEGTALVTQMRNFLLEAAQWGRRRPDIIVRAHWHRFWQQSIPCEDGHIEGVVTPAWQLKTPFVERIDPVKMPHIGGIAILVEDKQWQIRHKIYPLPQPTVVRI